LNWTLDDSTGEDIEIRLRNSNTGATRSCGSTHPLAAARILLQSEAVCAGRDKNMAFAGSLPAARIHTVDPPPRGIEPADWPVVCTRCRDNMGDNFLGSVSHAIRSARSATLVAR
jgi:hypothetical protein